MIDRDKLKMAGAILKNLRLEYGMTQQDVADHVCAYPGGPDLCVRHYRRIECGLMTPSVLLSISICTVLDSDVYEVWG